MTAKSRKKPLKSAKRDRSAGTLAQEPEIRTQVVDGKAAKAKNEEYLSKIIEMKAEGFDVQYLSGLLENDSPLLASEFERMGKNIDEIRKIKNTVIDIRGVETEAGALIEALNYPDRIDDIRALQKALNNKIRLRALGEQLDALNSEGLESDVARIKNILQDPMKADEAEREIKNLKAKIRERFFLGQIKKEAKPVSEPKKENMVKLSETMDIGKSTMIVEDIYLLYEDCRFISHHTRSVRAESERRVVFKMLKAIRDFIRRSGKYSIGKLHRTSYEDRILLVYGSGNLIIGLVLTGEEPSWTSAVISRVLGLIDEKYHDSLEDWDGDSKSLEGLNQYMKVLMLTFAKLESKLAQ